MNNDYTDLLQRCINIMDNYEELAHYIHTCERHLIYFYEYIAEYPQLYNIFEKSFHYGHVYREYENYYDYDVIVDEFDYDVIVTEISEIAENEFAKFPEYWTNTIDVFFEDEYNLHLSWDIIEACAKYICDTDIATEIVKLCNENVLYTIDQIIDDNLQEYAERYDYENYDY